MGTFLFSAAYLRARHFCGFTIGRAKEGAQQNGTYKQTRTYKQSGIYRNLAVSHKGDNRSSHHKTASNAAQLRVWLFAQLCDHVSPAIGCN